MPKGETSFPTEQLCNHFFRDENSKQFVRCLLGMLDSEAINQIRSEGNPEAVHMIRAIDRIRQTIHATAQQNGLSF